MKLKEIFIDPASGQASMSRVCYGAIVGGLLLFSGGLLLKDKPELVVDLLKTGLITAASLYGANSVTGVVRRKGEPPLEPPGSPATPTPGGQ